MRDDEIFDYLVQTFEWDVQKARKNFMTHRVLFTEAATAFFDKNVVYYQDEDHSKEEQRLGIRSATERCLSFTLFVQRESELSVRGRRHL